MKLKTISSGVVFALSVCMSTQAFAGDFFARCEEDSLAPAQAIERVEWYQANYPAEIQQKAVTVTGVMNVPMDTAIKWYRHIELDDPIFGGPAARPSYPSFTTPQITNPIPYYAPVNRAAAANKPANYIWAGNCVSSCYKPGTELLFAVGDEAKGTVTYQNVAIEAAEERSISKVAVLGEDSTLESPQLTSQDVAFYTKSLVETDHDIIDFVTESGGSLKVTPNHPVVDGNGHMREARSFVVGESLVTADGSLDPIVSIEKEKFHGRVYNIQPGARSLLGNVVVAGGFLNGSVWYQNNGQKYLNRGLLRSALPAEALE